MKGKNDDFISLKEAAEITGYSSDYVGQLIRSGKLPGKQIFTNVSWVTTREALLEYHRKDKKGKMAQIAMSPTITEKLLSPRGLAKMYSVIGWIAVAVLMICFLFLLYMMSVSIDHRINANYLEKVEYAR